MMREIRIAMLGAGFMARAHSLGYAALPMHVAALSAVPVRTVIFDPRADLAESARQRYGFAESASDWRAVIDRDDIDAVDIVAPNDLHREMVVAAAEAGKAVLCEKPLAINVREAREMCDAVSRAGVVNLLAFTYRFVPAVQLARQLIVDRKIGEILSFRGWYLQEWGASEQVPFGWRFSRKASGSGTLGDTGSHVIDLARFLVGEISSVAAVLQTHIAKRPVVDAPNFGTKAVHEGVSRQRYATVDVDDGVWAMLRFVNGATGSVEATRNAWGSTNGMGFEIHGSRGSLKFDYERLNELMILTDPGASEGNGFRRLQVPSAIPGRDPIWPVAGMGFGYTDLKAFEMHEFVEAIANDRDASPSFLDGLRVEQVIDAVQRSSTRGAWVAVDSSNIGGRVS